MFKSSHTGPLQFSSVTNHVKHHVRFKLEAFSKFFGGPRFTIRKNIGRVACFGFETDALQVALPSHLKTNSLVDKGVCVCVCYRETAFVIVLLQGSRFEFQGFISGRVTTLVS